MLSKKYYIKIANVFNKHKVKNINSEFHRGQENMRLLIINDFMNWLKGDNPLFDINKFDNACNK